MCEKCNGTGVVREQVDKFDKAQFREVLASVVEFAEKALKEYDETTNDTDALLILGTYLMIQGPAMENNFNTVLQFSLDQMDKDPRLMDIVMQRAIERLGQGKN